MSGTGFQNRYKWRGWRALMMLTVLLPMLLPALAQSQSVSFEQAWQLLEENSPVVTGDRAAAVRARAEVDEAAARRWPELSVDARATRMNAPLELSLDPVHRLLRGLGLDVPPDVMPVSWELQRRQFYNLGLNAVWPLYAGGKIRAGVAAADAEIGRASCRERGEVSVGGAA